MVDLRRTHLECGAVGGACLFKEYAGCLFTGSVKRTSDHATSTFACIGRGPLYVQQTSLLSNSPLTPVCSSSLGLGILDFTSAIAECCLILVRDSIA